MVSTYSIQEKQIDGRYWVTETHTLDDGSVRQFNYLADANANVPAIMAEHVNDINTELANG